MGVVCKKTLKFNSGGWSGYIGVFEWTDFSQRYTLRENSKGIMRKEYLMDKNLHFNYHDTVSVKRH